MESEVTRVNIAITRIGETDTFAIGAELLERINGKDELYKVASLYINDPFINSIRKALRHACITLLDEVKPETKLVIFRSEAESFKKNREFKRRIGVFAASCGMDVIIVHCPGFYGRNPDVMELAYDAIDRKDSVIARIK